MRIWLVVETSKPIRENITFNIKGYVTADTYVSILKP